MRESWASRLGWAAVQIIVVVALWLLIGLVDVLAIGLIATIVLSTLVPPRWSNIASGLGLVGTALAINLAYGYTQTPLILGALGVLFIGIGAHALWSEPKRGGQIDVQ